MGAIVRVYLDTNVFACAARREEPPGHAASCARALLAMIRARRLKLVTSTLVRREIMKAVEPAVRRRVLAWIPPRALIDEGVHAEGSDLLRARALSARVPGLSRNDALHIALAMKARADVFVTEDRHDLLSNIRNARRTLGDPAFHAFLGKLRFVDLLEWVIEVEHG